MIKSGRPCRARGHAQLVIPETDLYGGRLSFRKLEHLRTVRETDKESDAGRSRH